MLVLTLTSLASCLTTKSPHWTNLTPPKAFISPQVSPHTMAPKHSLRSPDTASLSTSTGAGVMKNMRSVMLIQMLLNCIPALIKNSVWAAKVTLHSLWAQSTVKKSLSSKSNSSAQTRKTWLSGEIINQTKCSSSRLALRCVQVRVTVSQRMTSSSGSEASLSCLSKTKLFSTLKLPLGNQKLKSPILNTSQSVLKWEKSCPVA